MRQGRRRRGTATVVKRNNKIRTFGDRQPSLCSPLLSSPLLPSPSLFPLPILLLDPIDLTKEDDALQKALALSLQEMQQQPDSGGISLEDQELSR